jgi:ribosomal protein S18 acetylase RimI-like enzyme
MHQLKTTSVETVTPLYQNYAIKTLVLAFCRDPVVRWMYPNSSQYLTYFPQFIGIFGSKAFDHDTAFINSDLSGAALWLPPGVEPDDASILDILQRSVSQTEQAGVFAVFEEIERYHPSFPHWYLSVLGVDPTQQGKGYGSALMQTVLRQCDRDCIPAYLESSNPANIPFYERYGFEVLGTIQIQNSPKITPMIRYPS